jgi:hypothetical protein
MNEKELDKTIKIVGIFLMMLIAFATISMYIDQTKHPYKNITCDQLSYLSEEKRCATAWMGQWITKPIENKSDTNKT